MSSFYRGARVAITGAAGTTGTELTHQLLGCGVDEIIAIDRHETNLFYLSEHHQDDPRFHAFACDVCDTRLLTRLLDGVDYLFHAAALKHVWACESNPREAVQTNIIAVQSVIDAAIDAKVRRVLFTSTDKAVNPTNVMGTSKLMGERLITSAAALGRDGSSTVFASTRFGNVLGSAGSVVPLFLKQLQKGGPITVTDPRMSRFVMTLEDAILLVMKVMEQFRSGEVFVTRMPVVLVSDLARVMVEHIAPRFGYRSSEIKIQEIGKRPGEKLYEQLITAEESTRTLLTKEFLIVLPAFRSKFRNVDYYYGETCGDPAESYDSHQIEPIEDGRILEMLKAPGVLPPDIASELDEPLR
ncbi:polysaccharide biosynthesis protein [Ferruginivarius sediminum]|uniref:NAD-dependent epimerase/dehydratase family protein n=1 Tax=Ferruginivarius sediminum TaxID=2661937 RepID=A0A369TB36_9PROT|nr:polysaccharide biosynthesis protein [Ferruginivarius sediminum]RDD60146.1 NAD-dependent epimerase/dehydratase family protein [Ferruginivarius sediminum]